MTIIKIEPCDNGAHANQTKNGVFKTVPDGWAPVPAELEASTRAYLPWVSLTVENGAITEVSEDTDAKSAWEAYMASLEEDEDGGEN